MENTSDFVKRFIEQSKTEHPDFWRGLEAATRAQAEHQVLHGPTTHWLSLEIIGDRMHYPCGKRGLPKWARDRVLAALVGAKVPCKVWADCVVWREPEVTAMIAAQNKAAAESIQVKQ